MSAFLAYALKFSKVQVRVVSNSYGKANNPYLSSYDKDKPTSYIVALDMNNLYGRGQTQPQPIGNFKWLSRDEIDNLDISSICDDSPIGYILQVDMYYPPYLHDSHSDFRCAPEKNLCSAGNAISLFKINC